MMTKTMAQDCSFPDNFSKNFDQLQLLPKKITIHKQEKP